MVVRGGWIGLADDECAAAQAGPCRGGRAGSSSWAGWSRSSLSTWPWRPLPLLSTSAGSVERAPWPARLHGGSWCSAAGQGWVLLRGHPVLWAGGLCPRSCGWPGVPVDRQRTVSSEGRREAPGGCPCYQTGTFICALINQG